MTKLSLLIRSLYRCGFLLTALHSSTVQGITYDTIMLSGNEPRIGPDAYVSLFGSPVLNDAGTVVFRAGSFGTGNSGKNLPGILSVSNGEVRIVTRTGDVAPGTASGDSFVGATERLTVNNMGDTAFVAQLYGASVDSTNNQAIYYESDGELRLLARTGSSPSSADPSVYFRELFGPTFNDDRKIAFRGFLEGEGVKFNNDRGIYVSTDDQPLQLVVRSGEIAPSSMEGVESPYLYIFGPTINESGDVAFLSRLSRGGIGEPLNSGVFIESDGIIRSVAQTTDVAPIPDSQATFGYIQASSRINDLGHVAFRASLIEDERIGQIDQGIFSTAGGTLHLVARAGDPVPDLDTSVSFSFFDRTPVINDADQIFFEAVLSGPTVNDSNDRAAFLVSDRMSQLVVREGDIVPGAGPDVRFSRFFSGRFNDLGQAAFVADIVGPGLNAPTNRGLFATDASGNVFTIARPGGLFDVDPDPLVTDYRTILGVDFGDLNDRGQLAFVLAFEDRSQGIFLAFIPEPSSLVLITLVFVATLGVRR